MRPPLTSSIEVVVLEPIAVRIDTAARMADVSRWTIYAWLRQGKLNSVRVNTDQRILVDDLKKLLRSGRGAHDIRPQLKK